MTIVQFLPPLGNYLWAFYAKNVGNNVRRVQIFLSVHFTLVKTDPLLNKSLFNAAKNNLQLSYMEAAVTGQGKEYCL